MNARLNALRSHRQRLKKQGLKRLELVVPNSEAAVIRRAASVLREKSRDAAKLRQLLGFDRAARRAATAVDLFAMPEPPSATGDRLWDRAMAKIERDRRDRSLNRARKFQL